mgnify:CR=1 FL=1|jgi:hypothetical protein
MSDLHLYPFKGHGPNQFPQVDLQHLDSLYVFPVDNRSVSTVLDEILDELQLALL